MCSLPGGVPDKMALEAKARKPGYLYIYLSNENPTLAEVYFDDLSIKHVKSPVIQYNEYYPFGMQTANSWTRENTTGNNFSPSPQSLPFRGLCVFVNYCV
ncbi:MAG: hypothetical protein JNL53_02560 [Cyclobacteriaceae bacterium]|nr:hypothetical protein [Cyclobacteriaceae bacterium]